MVEMSIAVIFGCGLIALLGAYLIWDMTKTSNELIKQAEEWCKQHNTTKLKVEK